METRKVPAHEVKKNLGLWMEEARISPVIVTKHGRSYAALLNYDLFVQLKGLAEERMLQFAAPEDFSPAAREKLALSQQSASSAKATAKKRPAARQAKPMMVA